jgi:hypothetical protein
MIEKAFKDPQVAILLQQLGLPDNFLTKLYKEDDWSFIIKSHALIESVCTRLLCFHFNEPKIEKIYASLPLNNMKSGKLGFLFELELIDKNNIRMIKFLSEIRNSIVHEIRLSNFTLSDLIKSFDQNKFKNFAISFSPFESLLRSFDKLELPSKSSKPILTEAISEENMLKRAQDNPKFHILNGIYYLLTSTIDMHYYSDYLQWEKAKQKLSQDDKIF